MVHELDPRARRDSAGSPQEWEYWDTVIQRDGYQPDAPSPRGDQPALEHPEMLKSDFPTLSVSPGSIELFNRNELD